MHELWFCRECTAENDPGEKTPLNKVIIFVFFARTTYSCTDVTWTISAMPLLCFWAFNRGSSVYAGSESSWISSKIS